MNPGILVVDSFALLFALTLPATASDLPSEVTPSKASTSLMA